jgi:hypothetical protein
VIPIACVIAVLLPAPSFLNGAIDLGLFALLSIPGVLALGKIDDESRRTREVNTNLREASLRARHLSDYLPFVWRAIVFAATTGGLALFAIRVAAPVSQRQLTVPLVFAIAAPLFLMLYETWMKELATGGRTGDDDDAQRQRLVRKVFGVEVVLVSTLLGVSHALLNLNWSNEPFWVTGAIVVTGCAGIVGCALALSSKFIQRSYTIAPD